ncbi:MAG: hypothetical protein NDI94_00060 [Candidatus Woesearchaeota archaeon]|nr:hypothetical protein [Candidatus Woesearchaeota archaeon]
MKLTKKTISEVISQAVGIEAVDVALYLRGKTDVSELIVADDMKISIQEARSLLYKLYEKNLAKFQRKRDKHKGWHISHWDFLEENILPIQKKLQEEKKEQIKQRIEREQQNMFYICTHACSRVDFEKAIEINFKCPECGGLMNPQDNKRTIEVLNEKLKEIESSE